MRGVKVHLGVLSARKYPAATAAQKKNLGKPLDSDHNAGKRDNGALFKQFKGGSSRRTAMSTRRPAVKSTRFEHGKITYNTKTGKVTVRVNGTVVPPSSSQRGDRQ